MDRRIQQAVAQVLMPIFGPSFSASSFGFRPGRNAHPVVQDTSLYDQEEEGKSFVERADLVVAPTADPHGGWCGGADG